MSSALNEEITFTAFYYVGAVGASGLTDVKATIYNPVGTVVASAVAANPVGMGLYSYTLPASLVSIAGVYLAVFHTDDLTVNVQDVPIEAHVAGSVTGNYSPIFTSGSSVATGIPGFQEAQVRLVAAMGNDVTFHFPASAVTYPASTAIDPETGTALDPFILPLTESIPAPIDIRGTVIRKNPAGAQEGNDRTHGVAAAGKVWVRLPLGSPGYDPSVLFASRMEIFGEFYRLERFMYDGFADVADTLYVEGELINGSLGYAGGILPGNIALVTNGTRFVQESYVAGVNQTVIPTVLPFIAGTTLLAIDGVLQVRAVGGDYLETGATELTMSYPLEVGQAILIVYQTA